MMRILSNVKRTHWASWAACRRFVRTCEVDGLTPARFDVIQLLHRNGPMLQDAIRKALGVVKSSASELLARLEECGFVRRSHARYRVGRRVELTKVGEDAYRTVIYTEGELETLCHALRYLQWRYIERMCVVIGRVFRKPLPVELYPLFLDDN
jgi:DNA-binding MarR family transcriptional regulator